MNKKKINLPTMRKVVSKHATWVQPLPKGVRELDKINFIDLYNMHADMKFEIDKPSQFGVLRGDRLKDMFAFVRYEPSDAQRKAIEKLVRKYNNQLTFALFLEIFDLKAGASFDKGELMRAFRLFSQEYEEDNVIKVSKVEEVLAEMDQMLVACGEHMEINVAELVVLLKSREKNGYVNYKEFIDEAFGSEN